MSLRVLRPADGIMMKLIKYNLVGDAVEQAEVETTLVHNHDLMSVVEGAAG